MIRNLTAMAVGIFASAALGGDIPSAGIQVIEIRDGRKSVFLDHGDVLEVIVPNGSGNFVRSIEIDVSKSPLKLTKKLIVQQRDEQGRRAVGGADIALFFDTTKAGTGELTIKVKRMFGEIEEPIRLKVKVDPSVELPPESNR